MGLGLGRSIHHDDTGCGGHPTEPSDSPATAAAAKDPSWVLLDGRDCRSRRDSLVADGETVVESRTSRGQSLRVSIALAPPPASSFIYYDCADAARNDRDDNLNAVAAHADSVLLRMRRRRRRNDPFLATFDHFVYRAGEPPSLSLLPPRNFPLRREIGGGTRNPYCRVSSYQDTGLLRRGSGGGGDDELLVAQLDVMPSFSERRGMADLYVLRHGRSEAWELKRSLPIVHDQGDQEVNYCWQGSSVIAVGDRYLCWYDHCLGFIMCDMAEDEASPRLRYVPRPGLPYDPSYYSEDLPPLNHTKIMGAAGDGAVRFVAIEPRCCCGGLGRSSCQRSKYAFTVTTWTLTLSSMDDEPLTWVKDGVMDCEEIWALPGYEGIIPRVHLEHPIVSLDNPDMVCFRVASYWDGKKPWMIQVDMRRKALVAAVQVHHRWMEDMLSFTGGKTSVTSD